MRLGHTEVFVRDVAVARAFWEGVLGFDVVEVQHGGRIVWLRLGESQVRPRPAQAWRRCPARAPRRRWRAVDGLPRLAGDVGRDARHRPVYVDRSPDLGRGRAPRSWPDDRTTAATLVKFF